MQQYYDEFSLFLSVVLFLRHALYNLYSIFSSAIPTILIFRMLISWSPGNYFFFMPFTL